MVPIEWSRFTPINMMQSFKVLNKNYNTKSTTYNFGYTKICIIMRSIDWLIRYLIWLSGAEVMIINCQFFGNG